MPGIVTQSASIEVGVVSTLPPAPVGEGQPTTIRTSKYGEQFFQDLFIKSHVFVDEETYYVAANTTIGTAITMGAVNQTAWVTTTPSMTIYNGGNNKIYMDFLYLLVLTAGASLTSYQWAFFVDTGNRYSSGGTTITNVNSPKQRDTSGSQTLPGAVINFGAITAGAAVKQKLVGKGVLRAAIPVVLDQYLINFGAIEQSMSQAGTGGTNVVAQTYGCPAAVIAPGCTGLFYAWGPAMATTSPACEFVMGWVER
jgi:hypothetical protein